MPNLCDWRLRECDHGVLDGAPVSEAKPRIQRHLETPYRVARAGSRATARVAGFLGDLPSRWDGRRVLVIGHVAARWALDIRLHGRRLAELAGSDFGRREGWEHEL
jgi:2,3-bisphosphoglycerate-dependent phosphoglycerate mutase